MLLKFPLAGASYILACRYSVTLARLLKQWKLKKAIIKIFNISNELGDKIIQILKGIEAHKIPDWYEKQLKLVTEHQMLYEDGFIMNYDFFYDDIMN